MTQSLGLHSPVLDRVRALKTKQGRRAQQRFAVEGPTLLAEALEAGWMPHAVYVTPPAADAHAPALQALGARVYEIPERAMARISDLETPPGILAVYGLALHGLEALLERGEPALVLAGVADPGNAGTLVRSAEIFGVRQAIFAASGVEPHNGKVVRATMGAVFRTRWASASADELVQAAARYGYAIVAATRQGTPLSSFRFPERALLAVGNERHGVADWLPHWDMGVAIPQRGGGESLNAAVAGGIVLFAFSQQFYAATGDPQRLDNA